MNRFIIFFFLFFGAVGLSAQNSDSDLRFTEASDLTILGKVFPDTPSIEGW
jgi:hypothetical protein